VSRTAEQQTAGAYLEVVITEDEYDFANAPFVVRGSRYVSLPVGSLKSILDTNVSQGARVLACKQAYIEVLSMFQKLLFQSSHVYEPSREHTRRKSVQLRLLEHRQPLVVKQHNSFWRRKARHGQQLRTRKHSLRNWCGCFLTIDVNVQILHSLCGTSFSNTRSSTYYAWPRSHAARGTQEAEP
jgi:hypothetical protein